MVRKNPLNRRFLRQLKNDAGKYLTIFLLLTLSISFVSGFLVADNSMIITYDESFEKYNIEDGHFRVSSRLNRGQEKRIQAQGVSICELFYGDEAFDNGSTLRIFVNREAVNLVCVMDGRFPETADEIMIDRMYADNNHIRTGDTMQGAGKTWKVCGLAALSDYSTMFESNSDSMFDAVRFGVAVVSKEGFASIPFASMQYCYAWKYQSESSESEQDRAETLMEKLNEITELRDYVPRYLNQAIMFTGDDMGSDKVMMEVLLYIIIVICAFVFGVTISDTINKESAVIGTLRAQGYTRSEIIIHYMTLPVVITLISAAIGNLLGYTLMKDFCASMYYGSYSLPTYITKYNPEALFRTTVIPCLIMAAVTWFFLHRKLKLSPLRFLRRDLSLRRSRRAVYLPHSLPFLRCFHLRVMFRSLSSYAILAAGIFFANFLLMFGLALPALMTHYQQVIADNLLGRYQYILTLPVNVMDENHKLESLANMAMFAQKMETDQEGAEKFSAWQLKTCAPSGYREEDILIYGIQPDSAYITASLQEGDFVVSSLCADKYGLHEGDTFRLHEAYEDKEYEFTVTGIYDYLGAVTAFMNQKDLNRTFGLSESAFSGYFSDQEITDLDQECISTVIDEESLTKITRQLMVSMGSLMYLVDAFSVIIFVVLIYILSRVIIEKNRQPIAMLKILGCTDSEVRRLYLRTTTVITLFLMAATIPLVYFLLVRLCRVMIAAMMSGWMPMKITPEVFIKMFALGAASYAAVAVLEYRKIRNIPKDEALKNAE